MSEDNRRLAESAYAALNRRDLDGFLDLVHPEVEFGSLIAEADGRTWHGHDGVRDWWTTVVHSVGGLRFEPDRIESFGDDGITGMRIVGTIEGVEVRQELWQAWRVRDGRVAWWHGFRTRAEAAEALAEQAARR